MSDRKYRQHGYQDSDRDRERRPSGDARPQRPREPYDPRVPRDPRVPNMPGFRQVFKCGRCGHVESMDIGPLSQCGACGVPLHACIHCDSFDPGARFECRQTIPARVSPKDARNDCGLFAPRVQVERETGSAPASQTGRTSAAKKAFDDLFKR
jgi:hypothetical protein